MMKDFWGNDAIDFGSNEAMCRKYADNIIVFVTDKPLGDGFVLFLCAESEENKAYEWLAKYDAVMKEKGILAYGAGVNWGINVAANKYDGFVGGIGF